MSAAHIPLPDLIAQTRPLSRFLGRMLDSRPWLQATLEAGLAAPLGAAAMRAFLEDAGYRDPEALRPALRKLRAWTLSHLAVRDLAGLAPLAEVTETMSCLADVAVAAALEVLQQALLARYGAPLDSDGQPQELIVIGMGKLGGRELNVSSDIDLIFIYPEDGDTAGPKVISNFEYFERLGKQLIASLAEITGDGQVFRVDMRLRPNGDSGPLVCSRDMLENYFITQGREWERYAWIKARPMSGSPAARAALEETARPFVFRKYLDFGAINAMRDLHAQIRREVARKANFGNVKLGPGGIREVEFIAQVFQLIRGGRERALQIRPTLAVLAHLAQRHTLPPETVAELAGAYDFLRRLEHRLQYLDDAQTHTLPETEEDQALIARAMGCADFAALLQALDAHRESVSRHFDNIFGAQEEGNQGLCAMWANAAEGNGCVEALQEALENLGYAEPDQAARRLHTIRGSARYRQLPDAIRSRFDALVPRILEVAAQERERDATLARCLDLLEAISGRGAYLALLQEFPQALQRVAHLVGAARWAAEYLTGHPILLDELLDPRNLEAAPDWPGVRSELAEHLAAIEPDMERQMDLMRESHHAEVFRLLTQDIAGKLSVEHLADHLSALADLMLDLTIPLCWHKIRNPHRETPRFAVIAYGKLGGKELGYASDLDIVFLYDDEAPEAAELYNRLAQRVNSWLSSRTSAGILFETDLRLRPNGDSGLLACSMAAFRKYQLESAWVWEHQALTRARFAAGDPAIGATFEEIRREVLCLRRDPAALRAEVLAMRQKMMDAHANKSPLFDLKHDRGGLVDVEFIIQFLVLGYAADYPRLTGNLGNIALLGIAGELGLIPADLARCAGDAYRDFRRLQHRQRLNGLASRVPPESVERQRAAVTGLWELVMEGQA